MIYLKSKAEIEKLRTANLIAAEILEILRDKVAPGVKTCELDDFAQDLCKKKNVVSAFKGYRGYPKSLCTSINEQIVHGIPSDRKILDGDILSLDFGVLCDGFYGDCAITVPVGNVSEEAKKLISTTEKCLEEAIKKACENNHLYDISASIQKLAESNNYSVVREFVGHGIGRNLHEDPQVPNFGKAGRGIKLQKGMVFAIEPMVNLGTYRVKVLEDGWTAVTQDGKLSAHFEHVVAITDNGPFVLTKI